MRTAQPVDAWTAYFTLLTQALSASPSPREFRREVDQPSPKAAVARIAAPAVAAPLPLRRGLIDRLDHWFWSQRQRSFERQLAQCNNIYELEAQMRTFERPAGNLF